jgi:hypothetical protein
MSWLNPGRWLLIGGLMAALWLGYGAWAAHQQGIGDARATARYNAAIDKQKTQAGQLLKTETDRANAATVKLINLKIEREKQDVENQSAIDRLAVRLRAAAGPAARLRDPHAARCGGGGGGAPAADLAHVEGSAADGAEAGGVLSKQLTEFLLSQAADADQVNLAYTSCRLDALSLREVLR